MNTELQAKYAARAEIVRAMGHPTRLFIVDELSRGERCVCELRELIGADMSTVSKHLLLLKNVGIIASERRGTSIYYRLRCCCIMNFFSCVETVLKANLEQHLKQIKL